MNPNHNVVGTASGKPGGARKALIFLLVVALAFIGWIGVRVSQAVGTRKQAAQAQQAKVTELKAEASGPRKVDLVRGAAATWEAAVAFEGTLSPREEADLGFKTPGRLATIRVKVGDRVRKGQVLGTLSTDEASAQLAAAQAQVAAAEAQMALAADAEKRTSMVVASGAQSEAVGVQARKQKDLAEAQRDAAKAQAALARTALDNHVLVAPFPGTITKVPSAVGAVVAPGVPLFHLADLATLKLTGSVRAADAALVKVGSAMEILGDDRQTVVGHGKLTAVVPQLDAVTKRVPIEATIVNDGPTPLLAGTLVRARVAGGKAVPVLKFPHTVLRPGTQDELLVVTGGRLQLRKVEHALAPDGSLLVRKGVGPEDDVVLVAWPEATDGQPVAVAKAGGQP